MELLTSLPADLAALADPSVRGPAPLLRPPDGGGTAATPATPFELCLALLTAGPPGGESWPPGGKELPLPLLEPESDTTTDLAPAALLAFIPAPPADPVLQAQPRGSDAQAFPLPTAASTVAPPLPQVSNTLPPPLPSGGPAADAAAPQSAAELDSFAALTTPEPAPLPLEAVEPHAATATKSAPAPRWLEAFIEERRVQRPLAAAADRPSGAAPVAHQAAPASLMAESPQTATAAIAEPGSVAQGTVQRGELPNALASAAAPSDAARPPDWLPPPTGNSAATGAAAQPAAMPQTPVDLRSPGWQDAFANRVQYLVDTNVGEARIKLNPPELGAVDVKISLVDDKTYVQLTTATAAARDELTNSLPRLRDLFAASGLELGGASVHSGRGGQQETGRGHGGDPSATRSPPFPPFAGDDGPAFAPHRSLGRIDVFA